MSALKVSTFGSNAPTEPKSAQSTLSLKTKKGKIKTHKIGHTHTTEGAVIFGLTALLTGGLAIGFGLVGGALIDGGLGHLYHIGLKISKEEKERLNQELDNDKAAVGVMVNEGKASSIAADLTVLGGQAKLYEVTDETMAEIQSVVQLAIQQAAQEVPDEVEDESLDEPSDELPEDSTE